MPFTSFLQKLRDSLGFKSSLSFDQQIWGAKSVMDLVQQGSQFLLAEGTAEQDVYTCWLGSRDNVATAVVVSANGKATGPFPDSSKITGCIPWTYPPKISCAQATKNMQQAGITEAWVTCRLRKTFDQSNPVFNFTFESRSPVSVDAETGNII